MTETLERLADGTAPRVPQDPARASYVPKLERTDGRLDWTMSATALERRIRAYDPWPGTFTMSVEDGAQKRLKILPPTRILPAGPPVGCVSVADGRLIVGCGEGALEITTVHPEGGRRMSAADFLRGRTPGRFC